MQFLYKLTRLVFLLLFSTSFLACNTTTESDSSNQPYKTSAHADQNIDLVQKFINAQMTGDDETMRRLVRDDFIARNPAGDTLTIDQYAANWKTLSQTRSNQDAGVFATNGQTVTEGPLSGEWVMFWGTYTATLIETQEDLEVLWHADFKIENGKISRSISYFNMAGS